jgi:peptidoglycan hydrolase-like amidase
MSQYTANVKALNGDSYDQILKFFFQDTELAKFE